MKQQPSDTEEYVNAIINEDKEWHKEYDESLLSITDSINNFLAINTDNSLYTLCTFLTAPEIIKVFKEIPEIAHCFIAANITANEFNNNLTDSLYLKNTLDISGVIQKNTYYKFLLLNIEYNVDKEKALKQLALNIYNKSISHIALEQLINTTSLNKEYVTDCILHYIDEYDESNNRNEINIPGYKAPAIINCSSYENELSSHNHMHNISDTANAKNNCTPVVANVNHDAAYDATKFCFIICSNNEQYEAECIKYINNLTIPDGYTIDIIVVHNAASMTSGYNRAMLSSNAKYKIYIHQDVFIINKNILSDILKEFDNPHTGMIGMVGSKKLPRTCIMWFGWRIGHFIANNIYHTTDSVLEDIKHSTSVEAIDGFIMITQYDIPWREDIFTGWDFYDISQSFPPSVRAWCFHDDGIMNLDSYYDTRKIFMKEYVDMLH